MARIKYWDIASQSWKYADQSISNKGTSITHSWDGTTLIVTSASGTSSANLKGDSGIHILSEGETLEDVPEDATVVVDPYGDADMTIEQVIAATLEVIENGTY